jgi:hypothetical protein
MPGTAQAEARGRKIPNPKHQIPNKSQAPNLPNFKQAPSTKSQYPNKDKSLSTVFCLEFGIWCLGFFSPPVCVFCHLTLNAAQTAGSFEPISGVESRGESV